MNEKVVVLIDLDDTMTYLVRAWCQCLNRRYGTNVSEGDIRGWRMSDYFPDLTEDQVFAPLGENDFWREVEPVDDAPRYIKLLLDEGYDVYVCTASSFDAIKSKFDCILGRFFPFIPLNRVIVTGRKQLIRGNVLIDDGIHNLEGGAYEKILMSRPHNQSYNAEIHGMKRVCSWKEAYDAIHRLFPTIYRKDRFYECN